MRKILFSALTLSCSSLCFGAADYPNKPVRMIVSFQPGSGTDLSARIVSEQLAVQLGKSFVVENRPGAGGTIGNELVARSAADGYTLLMAEPGFAIAPGLRKSLSYNAVKDFTPITAIMRNASALVVNNSLKAHTVQELIALARANPGKINFGSAGIGSNSHMNGELFKMIAKVNIVHVPYKGGGGAMAAVIANQVQMLITGIPSVLSAVKSGKSRALAVTDSKRWPSLPDVPSMSEAGISSMALYTWYGLMGPAALPKSVVDKLYTEVVKALREPSVRKRLVAGGGEIVGNSPKEFATFVSDEIKRWGKVIKTAGISSE